MVAVPSAVAKSTDELKVVAPVFVTVNVYMVVPLSPSMCVTSSIEKLGSTVLMLVLTV